MTHYNEITTLYVSTSDNQFPNGSMPAPCDNGGPLRSIESALDIVSQLRRTGLNQPISIKLRAGIYSLEKTIKIGPSHYGITIEPYANEHVKIIGGIKLDGFEWDEYNGKRCLSADLPCDNNFTDFYVNGKRAKMTRYPSEGYLYPDDVEVKGGNLSLSSKWFIAKEGDIKNFKNVERIQISFCHYWVDEHTPIHSYDSETRRVTFEYPSRFNISGEKGSSSALEYYLENVGEMFSNPDEWYVDENKVYYIPRDDSITPETIDAYIPTISKLFSIEGTPSNPVRNVRLRGLDMGITRGEHLSCSGTDENGKPMFVASAPQAVADADGSVSFKYASGCFVQDCRLTNFGVHGFVLWQGSKNIRISNSTLYDGGAGGIKIDGGAFGSPESEHACKNTIENCTITCCGRRYFAACGILSMNGYENTFAHNEIGYMYYTGISVGWVWGYGNSISRDNLITKNHIHHIGNGMLSDMGGIYLLGSQPGTIVSYNHIHDVKSKTYGGWAIYPDEGSSFIIIENNVCYNTSENVFHQHYGSMNTVRNNIFAFSDEHIIRISRDELHMSTIFENNILYSSGAPMYNLKSNHVLRKSTASQRNIMYDCKNEVPIICQYLDKSLSMDEFQKYGFENESIIADPLFVDATGYNFRLKPESPAFALGFKEIDISDAGPIR